MEKTDKLTKKMKEMVSEMGKKNKSKAGFTYGTKVHEALMKSHDSAKKFKFS